MSRRDYLAGFNYKNQRYAVGLVFVCPLACPLGDLIRRRPILLVSMFTSGSLPVGLALTKPIVGFKILSFFVAISSITMYCCKVTKAQRKLIRSKVLMPLTADLALWAIMTFLLAGTPYHSSMQVAVTLSLFLLLTVLLQSCPWICFLDGNFPITCSCFISTSDPDGCWSVEYRCSNCRNVR